MSIYLLTINEICALLNNWRRWDSSLNQYAGFPCSKFLMIPLPSIDITILNDAMVNVLTIKRHRSQKRYEKLTNESSQRYCEEFHRTELGQRLFCSYAHIHISSQSGRCLLACTQSHGEACDAIQYHMDTRTCKILLVSIRKRLHRIVEEYGTILMSPWLCLSHV